MTPAQQAQAWAATQWQKGPATPRITEEQKYRQRWSQTLIDRGKALGSIPYFGSREWCELADNDPRKAASAVRAAEAWAREGDDLAFTVAQEAYNLRRADDEFWAQMFARRRGMVDDHLEQQRRNRARAEHRNHPANNNRTYYGGPVDWETGAPLGDGDTVDVRDGAGPDGVARPGQAAPVRPGPERALHRVGARPAAGRGVREPAPPRPRLA